MKVATKFVSALTAAQQNQLEQLAAEDPVRRVRMRAHSLLLSAEGLSIDEIARVYQVHRNSVSSWIDHWHQQGMAGLSDRGADQVECGRTSAGAPTAQGASAGPENGVSPPP